MTERLFDLITLGRVGVSLYPVQAAAALKDVRALTEPAAVGETAP